MAFHVSKLIGYVPPDAKFTMRTRRFYTAQALQRDLASGRAADPVAAGAAGAPRSRAGGRRVDAWSAMTERRLSFVIPARNEEALIGEVLEAILASVAQASGVSRNDLWLPDTAFEVVVADDGSEDATAAIVGSFARGVGVRLVSCVGRSCAAARNAGAAASSGRVLCFVDADTIVPENAVDRILELHEDEGRCLVLYRLASREPGIRAWLWWTLLGAGATPSPGEGQVDAGVHELRPGALRELRPLQRVLGDRRGVAADRGGLSVPP